MQGCQISRLPQLSSSKAMLQQAFVSTLLFLVYIALAVCSPPPDPIKCVSENKSCNVTNSFGYFPDRITNCRASQVFYPESEREVVQIVASAARSNTKVKVVTETSHSSTKLVCPDGQNGILLSTKYLNGISIDSRGHTMSVGSGVWLRDAINEAARVNLALPYAPYFWGLTVGGMISTAAHGSTLWGNGSAVHERVVGLRIVTPATKNEKYAKVIYLTTDDEDLNAAKVSLGVLGVITSITLQLDPLFKRNVSVDVRTDDSDLADRVVDFGWQNEFADIQWLPSQHIAVYRIDNRVPLDMPGDGTLDNIGLRPIPKAKLEANRILLEALQERGDGRGVCGLAANIINGPLSAHFGWTNDGHNFTGYPVIGFQNNIQASGACLQSENEDVCPWDYTNHKSFLFRSEISVSVRVVKKFIRDVQELVRRSPMALCSLDLQFGLLMRYGKGSTAYLGKPEDSVIFDFIYYRSRDPRAPRLYQDIIEELEQIAIFKYGGLPHWSKGKNTHFCGVIDKYPNKKKFLHVRNKYDPNGIFSNEWTDQMLTPKNDDPMIFGEGCALDGMCICRDDSHCAASKGNRKYKCSEGIVFEDARVCAPDGWLPEVEEELSTENHEFPKIHNRPPYQAYASE